MMRQDLLRLEKQGSPIRVGVSGAGWIGSGFVAQVSHVPGMVVNVLADRDVGAAQAALEATGVRRADIVEADVPGTAMDALRAGKCVVTGDYTLAAQLESVDIVADVTPSPATGAETAFACIQHGKDVVMVNIEADVTVGEEVAASSGVEFQFVDLRGSYPASCERSRELELYRQNYCGCAFSALERAERRARRALAKVACPAAALGAG